MQPESKPSPEIDERYEQEFGAAGRRRGMIIMAVAMVIILGAVIGITRSMSYVGGLSSQVYDAFDTTPRQEQAQVPEQAPKQDMEPVQEAESVQVQSEDVPTE